MIIAIISILIITSIVWLIKSKLKFKICPICVGVALTWLWMFIGMLSGKLSIITYQLPTALLMGGTVVGSMFKLEQFIKPKFLLFWKMVYVIFGFLAMYNLLIGNWVVFVIGIIIIVVITFVFKIYGKEKKQNSEKSKQLEKMMENCC